MRVWRRFPQRFRCRPNGVFGAGSGAPDCGKDGVFGIVAMAGLRHGPVNLRRRWTALAGPRAARRRDRARDRRRCVAGGSPSRWIAVPHDTEIHLYSQTEGASAWSDSILIPTWPTGAGAGPAGSVLIRPGPGSLVVVAASIPNGTDGAFSSLFSSTDDGRTFVEHPAVAGSPANVVWNQALFVNSESGFVVGGTTGNTLLQTSDGGATWATVSVTIALAGHYYLGAPIFVEPDVDVPLVNLPSDGSGATLSLLVGHPGAAAIDAVAGTPLDLGTAVNPVVASLGKTVWVAPTVGGTVYETTDGGRTWATVRAKGLPSGVSIVTLTGTTSASAVIGLVGCMGFVPDCWTSAYLVATTDAGKTWTPHLDQIGNRSLARVRW